MRESIGELERKVHAADVRLGLGQQFHAAHARLAHVELFQGALSAAGKEVAAEHVAVGVEESDGFDFQEARIPSSAAFEVGAVLGFLIEGGTRRCKTAVHAAQKGELRRELHVEAQTRQPCAGVVGRFDANLPAASRVGRSEVAFQETHVLIARTGSEGPRAFCPFGQHIARPSVGFRDAVGVTAGQPREEELHAPVVHGVAVVLLETVLVVDVIA